MTAQHPVGMVGSATWAGGWPAAVELWAEAAADLPGDADHTEIARWLDPERFRFPEPVPPE